MSIFFKSGVLLAVVALSGTCAVRNANAAAADDQTSATSTSACQSTHSDPISQLAMRENCFNQRAQAYQKQSKEAQAAREKRIQDLKAKYENAPAAEKARLQSKLASEQSKLNTLRDQQNQRLQALKNMPNQQLDNAKALGNKTRSDIGNLLNGGL